MHDCLPREAITPLGELFSIICRLLKNLTEIYEKPKLKSDVDEYKPVIILLIKT